jgi:hypothetical protein
MPDTLHTRPWGRARAAALARISRRAGDQPAVVVVAGLTAIVLLVLAAQNGF